MSINPQVPSGQPGPAESSLKNDAFFWDFARFQVEGSLFQLPIRPFIDGSETFASRYGLAGEDKKDDKDIVHIRDVIVLDVELLDFVGFLKVLMPPMTSLFVSNLLPTLSKAEWISTLRLSTLWSFTSLRHIAIDRLGAFLIPNKNTDEKMRGLIEFVALARAYKVSWWLSKSYQHIINVISDSRPLTLEEANKIRHDTAHELNAIAVRKLQACRNQLSKQPATWNPVEELNKSSLLRSELTELREAEEKYGPVGQDLDQGKESSNSEDSDSEKPARREGPVGLDNIPSDWPDTAPSNHLLEDHSALAVVGWGMPVQQQPSPVSWASRASRRSAPRPSRGGFRGFGGWRGSDRGVTKTEGWD